jgi:hypothetical protein
MRVVKAGRRMQTARLGAQDPTAVALSGLNALSEQIISSVAEMSDVMFARAADKIVLFNPQSAHARCH